jgi:hypothetical protein
VNNGASWTSVSTGLPTSGDYIDISSGDFDNDGSMDIVTAGSYSSTHGIHVYYGDGSSWTENSDILPTSNQYMGNYAGDLDGDGNLDILFGGNGGRGVIVYRNLGTEPLPPKVSSTSPSDSAEDVPINSAISIVFSKAMNTSSVEEAIITSPVFAWSASWTSGNTAVTLNPSANLGLSTEYTITIQNQARSADDLSLESSHDFSFTTGDTVDTTAPTVLSSSPSTGASDVDITTEITITFSEPMDTAATEGAILISPGTITKRTWDGEGSELTLSVVLEPQTTYTITISQSAKDFAGNTITSAHSLTFTTARSQDQVGDCEESDSAIVLIAVIVIVVIVLLLIVLMTRKK